MCCQPQSYLVASYPPSAGGRRLAQHSTLRMTAGTYGHLSANVRRDWGDRMQRAMLGASALPHPM
jgi:hypothetical protein